MRELSLNNCRLDKRYDVREQFGRGSYAEIFLARDILASPQSPHSTVVIKALNVFLQDDLDADLERTLVENFQNEAIALDRVRHPNIISRIGHGTARDLKGTVFHYLVLEYLSGGDLQSLLRKQKVELTTALNYIEQICAGLDYAHRHSIIHRDIKPQNILLTSDLVTAKIADFGVARIDVSDSPITRVGTNVYAPPEHSPMSAVESGMSSLGQLTPAADIYSLAKTIYTLLTGEAPRNFANEMINSLPEAFRSHECANELIRVLGRATYSNPHSRHQSVGEFWADLAGIREIAAEGEFSTVMAVAITAPQPHVSRGYSPLVPERPSFEAVAQIPNPPLIYLRPGFGSAPVEVPVSASGAPKPTVVSSEPSVLPKKKRKFGRLAVFAILICLFTGLLYGTASYVRSRVGFPEILSSGKSRFGVASTDIYLRASPNTDNDPIGLVTKNSKVRIVNSENNWYQVDVVQQGRDAGGAGNTSRGWLNGKYLNIAIN